MKNYFFYFLILLGAEALAQESALSNGKLDTLYISFIYPEEVLLSKNLDKLLKKRIYNLAGSPTLKTLLEENTSLYFKEYGRGMLAGISLRGTGASHTLVLWNGLPINSKLNALVDFNTVYFPGNDVLELKKGGESVLFGTGAIGGVIQLGNSVVFKKKIMLKNESVYGSFHTIQNSSTLQVSNQKYYFKTTYTRNQSNNNYIYPGLDKKNINGAYHADDFSLSAAHSLKQKHRFSFHFHINELDRDLSGTLYAPSSSHLKTENFQNVISWKYKIRTFENQLLMGNIYEKYVYQFNKENEDKSRSYSNNYILKNEASLNKRKNKFLFGLQTEYTVAKGSSIDSHTQKNMDLYANWFHKMSHFEFNTSMRYPFSSRYLSPLLGRFQLLYHPEKKKIKTGFSISNNFKTPSFNDLYWKPGGNPALKPEKSTSIDVFIKISPKDWQIKMNYFYINSTDLIKWMPYNANLWMPVNIEHSLSRGIETEIQKKILINEYSLIDFSMSYSFQKVTNKNTHKQLPYVPQQMGFLGLSYKNKNWNALISYKYVGKVYTTTSNTLYLSPYHLINSKAYFKINQNIHLGAGINNLFNLYYETYPSRPQPGRNYYINLTLKLNKS